jgi:hypothetical protein
VKRLFLGVLLGVSLVAVLALGYIRPAHADALNPDYGSVISALDLTQQTNVTLASLSGVVEGDISLVNVSPLLPPSPILPPNPILPPSPIHAFHDAVARNAVDILTLRTTFTSLDVFEQPNCTDCTLETLDRYLSDHGIALSDVVTAQLSGAQLTVYYFTPTDPCVQNPLSACTEPAIGG